METENQDKILNLLKNLSLSSTIRSTHFEERAILLTQFGIRENLEKVHPGPTLISIVEIFKEMC